MGMECQSYKPKNRWRPQSSKFGVHNRANYSDALGGHDCANLEPMIEPLGASTGKQSMDGVPGAETHQYVISQQWERNNETLSWICYEELADDGQSCWEAHQ